MKKVLPYYKKKKTSVVSKKSESDLQIEIVKLLRLHNFIPIQTDAVGPALRFIPTTEGKIRFTQWSKARGWSRGLPDLIVVHKTGTFFLELKTPEGRLSSEQKVWRDRLLSEGYDWKCWRTIEECQNFIISKLNKK